MTDQTYTVSGFAVPEGLDELHGVLAQAAEEHPAVGAAAFMLFETAVIEIAGNVVEHGRPVGSVRWTFSLTVEADRLRGSLSDDGEELEGDPTDASLPDDPLADSGRGLALARATLDELDYRRQDGVNVWHMVRRLQADGS
ncbi:MAG TPA: ATP-binding protein [Nocardioides sp.]|nr:ATP-binding protein [Nocardioides sp.]